MTVPFRRTGTPAAPDSPVHQESLRDHNLALVFRQIVAAGARPTSRADLSASTGLTRATVSRIVDDLLAGRLVAEVAPTLRRGAGRPPTGLVLSREGPAGLGLDIQADNLAACIVDLTGTVRHVQTASGDQRSRRPDDVLSDIAAMAKDAMAKAHQEGMTVAGATLAVPGLVQAHELVRFAPHLGWREVEAGARLRMALDEPRVPVVVDNQANLAALGELYAGEDDVANFIYVSGEMGVGAGIVVDRQLLRGTRGWSGEIGHVTVYPDGVPCRCGSRGCLECYAGLDAVMRAAGLPSGPPTGPPTGWMPSAARAGGGAPLTSPASAIAELADSGSPAVLAALDQAGTALGVALAGVVNVLDIGIVVLGGSYAILASWLIRRVSEELQQRVITAAWAPVEVRPSLLGSDAAVIGAALTVVDEVRRNPSRWLGD